jgi:hypothetical protein
MGFRCAVCGYVATSYPRSAGLSELGEHQREEHPRRNKAVQKLRAQERERRSFLSVLILGYNAPSIDEVDPDAVLDDEDEPVGE